MTGRSLWVTRPQPGNSRSAKALSAAGYSVIALPVLQVETRIPKMAVLDAWPDWLILVSANAVRGLQAMEEEGLLPRDEGRAAVRVAAVGKQTAREAVSSGWTVEVTPDSESAEGLVAELAGQEMKNKKVWIPGGNREGSARRRLPDHLRSRGAVVTPFAVYETVENILDAEALARLDKADPGAVLLHSPSAAEAVYAMEAPEAVRRWHSVPGLCIGAATAARCRELGVIQILECESPSDRGILQALSSIVALGPERNSS